MVQYGSNLFCHINPLHVLIYYIVNLLCGLHSFLLPGCSLTPYHMHVFSTSTMTQCHSWHSLYFYISTLKVNITSVVLFRNMKLYCCSPIVTSLLNPASTVCHFHGVAHQLYPFLLQLCTSPILWKSVPAIFPLLSSGILSLSRTVLNNLFKKSTPHTWTTMSFGPTAFLLFFFSWPHFPCREMVKIFCSYIICRNLQK